MPEKKPWTEQQDKVLKHLFEVQKIAKWSKIAQKMADEYHMIGRNGKQCRQRYQSVLQPSFFHLQWTQQQQIQMYQLHDLLGNKWAQIAQRMAGRTDNCVKNHFYSNLRKAIRKLNKVISQNFRSELKQIRPIVLYKIIEATDAHFRLQPSIRQDVSLNCGILKNKLLRFASDNCPFQNDLVQLKQLGQQIQAFSKDYKRKPKKDRRGVAQSMNLMKVPKIDKYKCASDVEDNNDDESIDVSQRDSIQLGEKKQQQKKAPTFYKIKQVIEVSKSGFRDNNLDDPSTYKGIELLLKNVGLLPDAQNNNSVQINSQNMISNMKQSLQQSYNSQININGLVPVNKNEGLGFNLGESVQKFKFSFLFKQSGEIQQDFKLFRST